MDKGCRNCLWLYHMVTHNPTAPCSECVDYDKWSTMKQTNGDRIRSMTDEELSEYLWNRDVGILNEFKRTFGITCKYDSNKCKEDIYHWLKQEAE